MRSSVAEDTIGRVCGVDGAPSRDLESLHRTVVAVASTAMNAGGVGAARTSVDDAAVVDEVAVALNAVHTGSVGGVGNPGDDTAFVGDTRFVDIGAGAD